MRKQLLITAVISLAAPAGALAGPPFLTDDPEPVEYRRHRLFRSDHTAFYLAYQLTFGP